MTRPGRRMAFVIVIANALAVGVAAAPAESWFPGARDVLEVASLRNYNTRLVVLGTSLLGFAAGVMGSFLLLRKRSLMGDALSHACLPGVALMFMGVTAMGGEGKSLLFLVPGALVTGLLGVLHVMAIRNTTRIKDDTAMGIVLSVYFGAGVAFLGMLQTLPDASSAGLETFIYGKPASMVLRDVKWIACAAGVVLAGALLCVKEFTLVCFDETFAAAQGWPVRGLDAAMLGLVAAVTVVGMQAVGLILIIAFLITPAAAARFWTDDLKWMLALAGIIGGISGWLGASVSALAPRLPAGALIVLVAAAVFFFSMVFGTSRGVWRRSLAHRRLRRNMGRQHLLRAVYELLEARGRGDSGFPANESVDWADLLGKRSWSPSRLHALARRAMREDHIDRFRGGRLRLSESGFGEAARVTRNHRLWETYLITHAEVAPQHVDRDADRVEHVLGPDLVRKLEAEMRRRGRSVFMPDSPHRLNRTMEERS